MGVDLTPLGVPKERIPHLNRQLALWEVPEKKEEKGSVTGPSTNNGDKEYERQKEDQGQRMRRREEALVNRM